MAKGKVIYTQKVEKEIEIPDEIIALYDKSFWDLTEEEDFKICNFCETTWQTLEKNKNFCSRGGIYCEEDGTEWVLEEY